jgi:GH3 auxin-responsive promoter
LPKSIKENNKNMLILSRLIKRTLKISETFTPAFTTKYDTQERTLRRLLQEAAHTSFGKYYNFKEILRSENLIETYKTNVPIHDYNKIYDEWWHLQLKGHDNVTWGTKVKYYGLSSGTSGAPSKFIPESDEMLRSMRRVGLKMFFSLAKYNGLNDSIFFKDYLLIGGSATLNNNGHFQSGDLSGINANLIPIWLKSKYRPGLKVSKIKDWRKRAEYIAQNAKKWDIVVVSGLPSWVQLTLEYVVSYHKVANIHEIWPNLQIFVSGGIALAPYKKSMENIFGKPVVFMDTYLASEGFIAFQARPETHSMALSLNSGLFFEFIPFNDANFDEEGMPLANAKALNIDEVQLNQDYALLLSSNAGAWRYLIGDTVRFTDVERAEIIISGRTKHFLSVCGEHVSVDNLNKAIQLTQEKFNIFIPEFTVSAVKSNTHFAHKWYIGCDATLDKEQITQCLDETLKFINDDYAAERGSMMQPPQIKILPSRVFSDYLMATGKSAGQSKFPRVLKGGQVAAWENYIKKVIT